MQFEESELFAIARARLEQAVQLSRAWAGKPHMRKQFFRGTVLFCIAVFLFYVSAVAPPPDFPVAALVKIRSGTALSRAAQILTEGHLVRSALVLEAGVKLLGGEGSIVAGNYFFPKAQNALTIAARLVSGDFEIEPARVTIPEGANVREVGQILSERVLDFDQEGFLKLAAEEEGYLFPDTYFFIPGEEPDVVIKRMEGNFSRRITTLQTEIASLGKPLPEVITMASLLEEEAPKTEDRRIIAGILWKRISLGMPLQVDAVFSYIIGKNSYQLTSADLKTDSPYNTYTHKGLPPGPITNPGLDAILAAVTPTKTNYVYYLSDREGNFHYSATYAQHLQAKAKYLGT